MKFLLLIILAVAVLLVLRKMQGARNRVPPRTSAANSERMVTCAYCGVNQPVSECVLSQDRYYCSDSHRQEAESKNS